MVTCQRNPPPVSPFTDDARASARISTIRTEIHDLYRTIDPIPMHEVPEREPLRFTGHCSAGLLLQPTAEQDVTDEDDILKNTHGRRVNSYPDLVFGLLPPGTKYEWTLSGPLPARTMSIPCIPLPLLPRRRTGYRQVESLSSTGGRIERLT